MGRTVAIIPLTAKQRQLVADHIHLAKIIACQMHRTRRRVDVDDMISAGGIGLIRAAQRFDPRLGFTFCTFASKKITCAILDYLRSILPDHSRRHGVVQPVIHSLAKRIYDSDGNDCEGIKFIPDRPAQQAVESHTREELEHLLRPVSRGDRCVFERRYRDDANTIAIGQEMSITPSRVSQIHTRGLRDIRERLALAGE